MLFRKSKQKEEFETNVIFRDWETEDEDSVEESLKTLAAVVRDYGRYGFDLEDVEASTLRKQCDDWARRLLRGDRPGSGTDAEASGKDWKGVRKFVGRHRREEKRYVERTLRGFRDVIWNFIREVSQTVSSDSKEDKQVGTRLTRLRQSVQTSSFEELKGEVLDVVQFIGESIESRQRRQRERMKRLGQRLRTLRAELAEARREMAIDPLTRVYNRSALDQHLRRLAELSNFSGETACLFILDADHFKHVNDQYGHQAGDSVLEALANHCVRNFPRKSDFVARYGGEEFVITIDDGTEEICRGMGERLLGQIRSSPVSRDGQEISITASIGMALLEPGEHWEEWLKRADLALLSAKETGRDRLICAGSDN